ncbi:MAG: NADH-quinone oxidoreductase subunit NuoN [Alphaproteobacteria bacterium]|nr:NADH-quinone oxidoreductase subunit NuoN [Alphaproteobacteria bacterium]
MVLNLVPVLPEIFLALVAMGLLVVGAGRGREATEVIGWASVIALALAAIILVRLHWEETIILNGMLGFGYFAGFMKLVVIMGLIAALALSFRYLQQEDIDRFEYPILVLLAGIGMMLMISANNMLALYVSLELQSLSLYVLAAFRRNSTRSAEAGVKYFALGAISSGMILFGISLIYGYTGALDYGAITASLLAQPLVPLGVTFGLVFILAGLAFKISAVPFHMWTPDVYQGAPTSVTALFAMVPKIAAMAMLMQLLSGPFEPIFPQAVQIVWFLAAASMVVGAFAALMQENIKRLMAYSSIGNMGYALMGLVAGSAAGAGAVVLYMLLYLVMTAGTFAVILSMRRDGKAVENISDLAGLSQTRPALAYAMAVLMFSMSGIPPMAGFFGKLVVFQAVMEKGYYALAILGVLTSVVAAFYYLRIIKVMFFESPADEFDRDMPFARRAVLFISVFLVLAFIFKPVLLLAGTQSAAAALFS